MIKGSTLENIHQTPNFVKEQEDLTLHQEVPDLNNISVEVKNSPFLSKKYIQQNVGKSAYNIKGKTLITDGELPRTSSHNLKYAQSSLNQYYNKTYSKSKLNDSMSKQHPSY